jgi:predicted nucleotidyltransferase
MISAEELDGYMRTARRRWLAEADRLAARRARAWQAVQKAAVLLREVYGAQRVVLFGSLADPARFTQWSDVDLAVWGLTAANWLKAMAAVRSLCDEIELNLVDVACCAPELRYVVEQQGVPL